MSKDSFADRFERKQKKTRLTDLARKTRSTEDIESEEQILKDTPPTDPIVKGASTKRNDPCPCGSGKKFKKCCGAEK